MDIEGLSGFDASILFLLFVFLVYLYRWSCLSLFFLSSIAVVFASLLVSRIRWLVVVVVYSISPVRAVFAVASRPNRCMFLGPYGSTIDYYSFDLGRCWRSNSVIGRDD